MIDERRVTHAGIATRQLSVEGDGPGIVLVHGFGHPADTWRPLLHRLERAERRAVAVDLPGFGDADPLAPGPLLPGQDRFLAAVIAAHGRPVVVGNSLGATLALRALTRDAPMSGAVLMATAGAAWAPLIHTLPITHRIVGVAPWVPRVAQAVLATLLYGDRRLADPRVVADAIGRVRDRATAAALIASGLHYKGEVQRAALARITAPPGTPVTIVHGTRDRLVPVAVSRRLHTAIPHSRLVVLDGIGHCPQLDATERVAGLVLALLPAIGRAERDDEAS